MFVPMQRRHAAIDRLLLRRQDPSRSDQCTPGSSGRFRLFCTGLKNENADGGALLSDKQSCGRKVGCGREERWGSRREEEEEEGVRNVRTRSLGDHSPGSSSV